MSVDESEATPPFSKPSKVPSWILLGFVLGALFVLLFKLKGSRAPSAPQPAVTETELVVTAPLPDLSTPKPPDPSLSAVEAIWAVYGQHAIWEGDVTEVALWNPESKTFRDCFEVVRIGDQVYFRSIGRLTRPIADRGLGSSSPVQFTVPAQNQNRR